MSEKITLNSISQRSQKWDILKFLMIFFVVLGHAADFYTDSSEKMRSLFLFIYSFHMPVFIFVSGLFSKKTVNERRKDKIFSYLVLYIVSKLIIFFCKVLMGDKASFSLLNEGGLPWFMLALFAFSIITSFVKDFSPKYVLTVSVMLACFVGYDSEIGSFLSLSRIIVYFPFYYAGYCLDMKKIEDFCKGKVKKTVFSVIIVLFALFILVSGDKIYWIRPLLTGKNPFFTLGEYSEYGCILRLMCFFVTAIICCAVIIITPSKDPFGFISKIGQRTLSVYLLHYPILYILYDVLDCKSFLNENLPQFSGWIIVPISFLITMFCSLKIFNNFFSFISKVTIRKK